MRRLRRGSDAAHYLAHRRSELVLGVIQSDMASIGRKRGEFQRRQHGGFAAQLPRDELRWMIFQHGGCRLDHSSSELIDQTVERSRIKIGFRATRPWHRWGVSNGKLHFAYHLVHQANDLASARVEFVPWDTSCPETFLRAMLRRGPCRDAGVNRET